MCRCNVCGREFALEEGYYAVDFSSGRTFRFCDKPNCFEVGIQIQTAQRFLEDAPKDLVHAVEGAIFGGSGGQTTSESIYTRLLDSASSLIEATTGKHASKKGVEELLIKSDITQKDIEDFIKKCLS